LNILDENIIAGQRAQLRGWRIRFKHIGTDIGRRGMKDLTEIVPLLHRLSRPTFFTHDLGFFDPLLCHKGYSLVCLDVKKATRARSIFAAFCGIEVSAQGNNGLEKSFWPVNGV
jgi:hypothetical protein